MLTNVYSTAYIIQETGEGGVLHGDGPSPGCVQGWVFSWEWVIAYGVGCEPGFSLHILKYKYISIALPYLISTGIEVVLIQCSSIVNCLICLIF